MGNTDTPIVGTLYYIVGPDAGSTAGRWYAGHGCHRPARERRLVRECLHRSPGEVVDAERMSRMDSHHPEVRAGAPFYVEQVRVLELLPDGMVRLEVLGSTGLYAPPVRGNAMLGRPWRLEHWAHLGGGWRCAGAFGSLNGARRVGQRRKRHDAEMGWLGCDWRIVYAPTGEVHDV